MFTFAALTIKCIAIGGNVFNGFWEVKRIGWVLLALCVMFWFCEVKRR